MDSSLKPGDKVRVRANPGRIGILGNDFEGPEHRRRVLVNFLDGEEEYVLYGSLEKVEKKTESPRKLLADGRFGRTSDLQGVITYYRLSGRLANLIYSLNATNTDFYAYQFKPVLNFLESPCRGLLIADEVGLGKTIEAGLIWTELAARFDAKRLLVLCPAMLREKWKLELADRFGVNAEIADAKTVLEKLKRLRSYPELEFALIGSLQGLRPPKKWDDPESPNRSASAQLARYLDQEVFDDHPFDLVIIDEAHYLRNRETQTHHLGKLIRGVTDHLLLLSATPIQLKSSDLFFLLNLLDEDMFSLEQFFLMTLEANAPIVRLRDRLLKGPISREEFREALEHAHSARIFEDSRQIKHLIENLPGDEELTNPGRRAAIADQLDRINPLTKVITRTRKRDVHEMRVVRVPRAIEVEMSDIDSKFYESVTQHIRDFCSKSKVPPGFILTTPQRQMSSCMAAAFQSWTSQAPLSGQVLRELVYEAFGDEDETGETQGVLLKELAEIVSRIGSYEELREHDSKYRALRRHLKGYWEKAPEKKVVLFSYYRKTLDYLHERLAEDGIESIVLYGGMDKQEVIERFRTDECIRILLSSEVASEGVDLQFSSLVVNYDLPWNPMKIEQRIGRIDRIGQAEDRILIWNFVYKNTIDHRVYLRLLKRLSVFEQALGDMEMVLGEKVKELTLDLLSHKLTVEEENKRIEQTRIAIETLHIQEEKLEQQASQLLAHGDFVLQKIQTAKQIGRYITGEDLLAYIKGYLEEAFEGTRLIRLECNSALYELRLSADARGQFQDFLARQKWTGRTKILQGRKAKLLFENKLGKPLRGVERVTQGHPLVKFVIDHQRGDGSEGLRYHQVVAIELTEHDASPICAGNYVFLVFRWSFSGSREIEKLFYMAGNLEDERLLLFDDAEHLVNAAALRGRDWLGAKNLLDPDLLTKLYDQYREVEEAEFKKFSNAYQLEDQDRIAMMRSQLERHRKSQLEKLEKRIREFEDRGSEKQKRIIPALRGKVRALNDRIDLKLQELEKKSQPKPDHAFVCCGVIRVG